MDSEKEQKNDAFGSFGQLENDEAVKEEITSAGAASEAIEDHSAEIGANDTSEESVAETSASDAAEEKPAEANVNNATEESAADLAGGSIINTNATINTNSNEAKEKKGHGRVLALAAVLVLVLAGCVGAYFALTPKPSDKKEDKTVEDKKEEVAEYRLSGNDLSDFDLRFLQIEGKEGNVVYSPLSIKYALAMLKDGANGETKKQIEDLIGDYKAKAYINSKNTSLANAMFIRSDYKDQVLDSYISGLKTNYNADVMYDSFATPAVINNWVSDKTLGLVKNVLKDEDMAEMNYALVNALAIDQNWNYLLQCQSGASVPCKNKEGALEYYVSYSHEKYTQNINRIDSSYPGMKFNGSDNKKSVIIGASFNNYDIIKDKGEDFIRTKITEEYKKWLQTDDGKWVINDYKDHASYYDANPSDVSANVEKYIKELGANYGSEDSSTDFYLNDTDDAKVFAKDLKEYDGTTLQYVGIMPKTKDLKTFVGELTAEKGREYIKGLKELKKENFKDGVITQINAHIPLFKYEYNLSLKEDLEEFGVKDVFTPKTADLSNMTKTESYISQAKHGATIEFSNQGIKAGATSIVIGAGAGGIGFEYLWDVPVEKIDLTFDKPFVYLIRDKNSGEVWFVGTVYEPLTN